MSDKNSPDTAQVSNVISPIHVDVYGTGAGASAVPDAARFGVGAQTLTQIEEAAQARVDQRPGDYHTGRKAK
jgi:hypothetical protein